MYACIYVCMHVYTCVCMYIRMYACIYVCMHRQYVDVDAALDTSPNMCKPPLTDRHGALVGVQCPCGLLRFEEVWRCVSGSSLVRAQAFSCVRLVNMRVARSPCGHTDTQTHTP
jgi:hypothetical protein